MIKPSTFLLFYYLSLFMGSISAVDPKMVEENRNKYPWMVIIYSLSQLSGNINYGTIIHERVILTLANPAIERFGKVEFRVLANCFFNETHSLLVDTKTVPVGLKQVKEYHKIEYGSHKDLEVLILNEPLQISDKINVIKLYRENDQFDPSNCILLSLFGDFVVDSSKFVVNEVIFYIAYAVRLNKTNVDVVTLSNNSLTPLDDQGRIIQHNKHTFIKGLKFVGGPLYCKSKDNEGWSQLGVTDLVMKIEGENDPRLILQGNVIRIDNKTLHSVINIIVNSSDINNFNLTENILRY